MKRTVIICIVALLLTVAGSLFIYKNYLQVKAGIETDFKSHWLTTVRLIGWEAMVIVSNVKHKMVIASCTPSIINGNKKCLASIETVYDNLKEKNINLLFRLDDRGILTHCLPEDKLKGVTGKDFSFRSYFSEVKRTGRPYISKMLLAGGEVYADVEDRFKTIFIVVPLYDSSKFVGVLGASIDFVSLLEKIIHIKMIAAEKTNYCWVIDDKGIFVVHPIKEFVGQNAFTVRKERAPNISFEKINRIMREKMIHAKEGVNTYISGWHGKQKGKIKKFIAYAPFYLDNRQYSVAMIAPETKLISLSRKNFLNTMMTMAFIMAAMLYGLLYILSLDRRRIEALKKETELTRETKESRDYLQNLLETANDFIYTVDINGCFTYINPKIKDYGYTPDELIGKPFMTIMTEKHRGKRFEKSIGEKIPQIYNVEIRGKDGVIRICRISTSPLMDQDGSTTGLFATLRDITEHEQTKANLKYLKEYNEKIVASIPSSLLVLDRKLNIKLVNRAYNEIRSAENKKSDNVVGKNIKELFPDNLLKEGGVLNAIDEVIETGETRRLYGVKHASSSHAEKILNITASGVHRAEEDTIIIIIKDVTKRARMTLELENLVITDDLTKLFNRRYFYQKVEKEIVRAKRQNGKLSLIMLDLDYFKEYNDTFGHLEGDRALKEVGRIILSSIRDKIDSGCRYGGDEFVVILPDTDKKHASYVARRIQRSVVEKKMGNVGISAGIVEYGIERSTKDFIKTADDALYEAKKRRK